MISQPKACARTAKALAEGAEAAEDVDGMPEKSGVSSRSPTEEIMLQRILMATGKRGQWPWGVR